MKLADMLDCQASVIEAAFDLVANVARSSAPESIPVIKIQKLSERHHGDRQVFTLFLRHAAFSELQ